ncbi:MAG TPA: sulfite exporter TauE/SafE family protein [Acidimicrobiales bacterium]|nr:sulfite exporter TauE/SafE family protein [Acidimicrobiales bacterium]
MRALLVSPFGLLIGIALGALGAGGSILAVPVLVYAAGQAPQEATTTSLVLVGVAAVVGSARHRRGGRVRLRIAAALALAGIPGSLAGNTVNGGIDPDVLLLAFSGLIFIAAWRMAVSCPSRTRAAERDSGTDARDLDPTGTSMSATADGVRAAALVVTVGLGVGFLTGLFGVGGGFVIVPALTLLLGLGMAESIGTALVVVAFNCAVSLLARLSTSHIDWGVTLPFVIAAVVGVIAGERIADRVDQRLLLRVFAGVLVVVGVGVAGGAVFALV